MERIGGSANYTVVAAAGGTITHKQHYRVDGLASGKGKVKTLTDDMTYCSKGEMPC